MDSYVGGAGNIDRNIFVRRIDMERKTEARVKELEGLFLKVLKECCGVWDGEVSYQSLHMNVEELAREALDGNGK